MSIKKKYFDKLSDGREVYTYTLKNANGMKAKISEFGAAIVKLITPDKNGTFTDVVCGYDSMYGYENGDGYQGAVVGRWGNRIAKGRFTLDGVEYQLNLNDGNNHLHGGTKDMISHKIWNAEVLCDGDEPSLKLTCFSPDGEENYPGNLNIAVTYTLTNDNALSINYKAATDKKTVINLTNHSYFNLGGYASGTVREHILWVDADTYVETDEELIPTGRLRPVAKTPFDFTSPKKVGAELDAVNRDLMIAGGYDHCFNFKGGATEEPTCRATLYCPATGREMQVITNQPCVQVYSANFMKNPKYPFKGGMPQHMQNAICLETERMPDSMNHEGFTKCTLDVGEVYDYTTIYKFSVKDE